MKHHAQTKSGNKFNQMRCDNFLSEMFCKLIIILKNVLFFVRDFLTMVLSSNTHTCYLGILIYIIDHD